MHLSDTARVAAGPGRMSRVIIETNLESFRNFVFSMILVIFRIFRSLGCPRRSYSQRSTLNMHAVPRPGGGVVATRHVHPGRPRAQWCLGDVQGHRGGDCGGLRAAWGAPGDPTEKVLVF